MQISTCISPAGPIQYPIYATWIRVIYVNLNIEGNLVALCVISTVLVNTFRHRMLEEAFKDELFRLIIIVSIATIAVGTAEIFCSGSDSGCPAWTARMFTNLHMVFCLTDMQLWLAFLWEELLQGYASPQRIGIVLAVSAAFLMMPAIIDIPGAGLFSADLKQTAFVAIGVMHTVIMVIPVLYRWRQLLPSTRTPLLLISLMFHASIVAYAVTGRQVVATSGISVSVFIAYIIIQNRRFSIDQLTETMTRAAFINRMNHLFASSGKGHVLVGDIENFKYFNQKFGQKNGDRLLVAISRFFTSLAPGHTVYRYGGDQFAIILVNADESQAMEIIHVVNQRFESTWGVGEANTRINIRLAFVRFPGQLQQAEDMVNAIDLTLTEAKSSTRAEAFSFNSAIMAKHQRRREVELALRKAIENNSITVLYQPIFETGSLHIHSAEALARIDDPVLGRIMPGEFIPIAESTGLVVDITYAVLQQVCNLWNRIGDEFGELRRIAINLSAVNFLEPRMEQRLLSLIRNNGVPPQKIKFELTESMIVDSFDRVKVAMDKLSCAGISFSLDDYGRGYSTIEYLIKLPFSTVKLDRSIIQNSETHQTLIESIVTMLAGMDKKIVAEGVETEEQLNLVTKAGANRVQGFYFAKPMGANDLLAMIRQKNGEHQ